jgi:hypothetical protein
MTTPGQPGRPLRSAARLLVALSAGALIAGCGVPTHTDVHVEGPLVAPGATEEHEPVSPPGPDEANSPVQLVDYFLQAAAADPDKAVDHLREYIRPEEAERWDPDPQVMVVRVEDQFATPGDRVRVRLDVRVIGTLSQGMIEPRDETRSFELDVVPESSGTPDDLTSQPSVRYRIVNPPDMIMLSAEALAGVRPGYLTASPIYFWTRERTVLVPDLRWLPTAFGATRRAQTKLEWLVSGPAPWLEATSPLPGDVALEGNVVGREDRLDVTLTPPAADLDTAQLHAQLWWTLREEVDSDRVVWLMIDGDERVIEPDPSANPGVSDRPDSFVVVEGAVVPYEQGSRSPALPAALAEPEQVVSTAALSQRGHAALVHTGADGLQRLTVVTGGGTVDSGHQAQEMSRPVWLRHPGDTGLVVADGVLHWFATGDPTLREVPVPTATGPVTAVAVAPDGLRVALVAGGQLYVSSLTARDSGAVTMAPPRRLATTASDLAGVTFWEENHLAIIGEDGGRKLLFELTVDGASERALPNGELGAPPSVTNMVGFPGPPLAPTLAARRGEVLYEADGRAYRYRYHWEPEAIAVSDLAVELPAELQDAEPRAPFYRE